MQIQAVGINVILIREENETEVGGLILPDQAQVPTNRGKKVSKGKQVMDKGIQEGRVAVFSQHSGFGINIAGQEYVVLKEHEIIGLL
jgi:co-chaperonin GroES (HSP10)